MDTDVLQYVPADVPSDYFCLQISYYIYHRDTGARQYVHADVPSVYSVCGMIYYTNHRNMKIQQNVWFAVSPQCSVAKIFQHKHFAEKEDRESHYMKF